MASVSIAVGRRFRVSLVLPDVGRRRLIATTSLCTSASALWVGAGTLPFADLSFETVAAGVAIPWGIGWVTLLAMERRIKRDLKPAERRHLAEQAETVEVIEVRPVCPGEVIEGEVLR
ncbi:hypothetical protein ACQPZX_41310 [Actinoplanes sp. CA-142083]|uniref:hypothetical protein n=1 Tax=Actinoplanes sp. CA-142083 TaxID=3239903 RepID=UPI003D8AE899